MVAIEFKLKKLSRVLRRLELNKVETIVNSQTSGYIPSSCRFHISLNNFSYIRNAFFLNITINIKTHVII